MSSSNSTLLDDLERHVATGKAPSRDLAVPKEETRDPLVAAVFALSPGPDVRRRWSEAIDFTEATAIGKIAWVSSETDEVDEAIDRMLEGGDAAIVCEALARAGVAWEHPALIALLDDDNARPTAALIATAASPDEAVEWLEACEVAEDALEVVRAGALNVAHIDEGLAYWREELASMEGTDDLTARLDGWSAVLDPEKYARAVLAGDATVDWLDDPVVVADFLQVHGPTEWLDVLGIIEASDEPNGELASFLAVSAAAGIGYEEPTDDEIDELHELLAFEPDADIERWQPLATGLGLSFALAIAPDDELGLLGVQVAAHERLSAFELHSPGIPGLPLSATHREDLDLDASRALKEGVEQLEHLHEASVVAAVRTLSDLRALAGHDPERFDEHARQWIDALGDTESPAVRLATASLSAALGSEDAPSEGFGTGEAALVRASRPDRPQEVIATLEELAGGDGPLGLDCARRLAEGGDRSGLRALARLWEGGDPFRVAFVRDCLFEGVAARS
ncbi:MAG: hypothetical protein ACOCV2_13710 [Persicimonas sp.]